MEKKILSIQHEHLCWWQANFPQSWSLFGPCIHWGQANLDFLASALGELPIGLIYYPPEGSFYFPDYLFEGAYRPTCDVKVVALAKKLVNESVNGKTLSITAATAPLFHAAAPWVEHSKTMLAVEGNFFRGEGGHRRWIEGRYVEPVEKPSVVMFADSKIQRRNGEILSAPDAYNSYSRFCRENGLPQVKKNQFKTQFAVEVKRRWQMGIRNDLKANGRSLQGWRELAVV